MIKQDEIRLNCPACTSSEADELCTAGVFLWITELTNKKSNPDVRSVTALAVQQFSATEDTHQKSRQVSIKIIEVTNTKQSDRAGSLDIPVN